MTASAMPADPFWQIIERATPLDGDPDAHMEALRLVLLELSCVEVISFEVAFRRYLNEAYKWNRWGAAYAVHGGCSDDGFEYVRRWLVSLAALWGRTDWLRPSLEPCLMLISVSNRQERKSPVSQHGQRRNRGALVGDGLLTTAQNGLYALFLRAAASLAIVVNHTVPH